MKFVFDYDTVIIISFSSALLPRRVSSSL